MTFYPELASNIYFWRLKECRNILKDTLFQYSTPHFLSDYLAVSRNLFTFAAVNGSTSYRVNRELWGNIGFRIIFNTLYLAVLDILLTTHAPSLYLNILVYAREDSCINSNKQRAQRSSLCSILHALSLSL